MSYRQIKIHSHGASTADLMDYPLDRDIFNDRLRAKITMSWGAEIIVEDDLSLNRIIPMLKSQNIPVMYVMVLDIDGYWRHLNTLNIGEIIITKLEVEDKDEC